MKNNCRYDITAKARRQWPRSLVELGMTNEIVIMKSRLENNWIHKSLEILEKEKREGTSEDQSYLINTLNKLWTKQIKDFSVEDLRIVIGQNLGLKYLIPLAIEELQVNILAEGDFYEGDLLYSVLTSNPDFWRQNHQLWKTVIELVLENKEKLETTDTTAKIRSGWFNAIEEFQGFHKSQN